VPTTIQVLMTPACGHGQRALLLVREVLNALAPDMRLETVVVQDQREAERHRFPGSPTVRINGIDIDPAAPTGVGVG
jgi:hypothetical protein